MEHEIDFDIEFSTLEDAMEYAGRNGEKAIVTKDHQMYYVVDCESVRKYGSLGFDIV